MMPHHWPQVGAGGHRDGAGQHDASVVQKGGDWREIVLFGSGTAAADGYDRAPQTCRLLERIVPQAVDLARKGAGEIIFSVLAPHTHIAPHCASTNLRLTAHLGLQIPTKDDDDDHACYLQVADQTLQWKEGQIIVFDDSFQHEVHNNTHDIRAVLLLRFWHPNLPATDDRQAALQYVLDDKEADRQRRCNPPLPPLLPGQTSSSSSVVVRRNSQGMSQQPCPTCGRKGFETIRLVRPQDHGLFVCLCGREVK
jgi:Aspartyl/Asparaginyl beta-hydroxylase